MEKTHILIVGEIDFPRGGSNTSRIQAYSNSISDLNGKVSVLCLRPAARQSEKDIELPTKGIFENTDYYYASTTSLRPKSKLKWMFSEFYCLLNSLFIATKINKKTKIDVFLFYSTHMSYEVIFKIVAKLFGIAVIKECSEYPFLNRNNSILQSVQAKLFEKIIVKMYDGVFVISHFLENYIQPLLKDNSNSLLIPILIELERFWKIEKYDDYDYYIAYCGSPSGNKDGVDILIKAFSLIAAKFADLKLLIIGDSNIKNTLQELRSLASKHNVNEQVVFIGRINREEMPKYLGNATLLALSRPSSLQAAAGFPTKLGEYLATGKPVVITDVGEISCYLKDGVNAFICPPDDHEMFAEKLEFVLNNPNLAIKVGKAGREVAENYFDCKKYGERMIEYINKLKIK